MMQFTELTVIHYLSFATYLFYKQQLKNMQFILKPLKYDKNN